jgi:hypothetical protein
MIFFLQRWDACLDILTGSVNRVVNGYPFWRLLRRFSFQNILAMWGSYGIEIETIGWMAWEEDIISCTKQG